MWYEKKLAMSIQPTAASVLVVLVVLLVMTSHIVRDDVVLCRRQSAYQRIRVTNTRNVVRLYLDGELQFSSDDEHIYHDALVHTAVRACRRACKNVLLLGAGDGLAARECLAHDGIETVHVVDIDKEVTSLFRRSAGGVPQCVALCGNSLDDPRVTLVHDDAKAFVKRCDSAFDVILMDLPDPTTKELWSLYSREFVGDVASCLRDGGVMCTQAYEYGSAINGTIDATVRKCFAHTLSFSVHVPSFGVWGFVLAAQHVLG